MTNAELLASILNQKTRTDDFTADKWLVLHNGNKVALHDPAKRQFVIEIGDKLSFYYSVHEAADLIIQNLHNGND